MHKPPGQLIGVGVGPGDSELMTLKAARLIEAADVISYIESSPGQSQAKAIAQEQVPSLAAKPQLAIAMPMSTDRGPANARYDNGAAAIEAAVVAGKTVVFLCEGDPLFFGSFAYLLERLQPRIPCQVVPGIASPHAAASALQLPLTVLGESFAVVSGRHSAEYLCGVLQQHDSVVIMKAGRSRQKILQAIETAGRSDEAHYLEYISRSNQRIERDVRQLDGEAGPYFSLFVIVKTERGSR
jgi:precorrin-2/cobalt-factor-2 C20-methyltransferase